MRILTSCFFVLLEAAIVPRVGESAGQISAIEPLSKEWAPLGMVTAVHVLFDKDAGLALRVLEADGSSSVAVNPVTLFVVATNQGTSDLKEYIWRLPKGVARVRKTSVIACGLLIAVDTEVMDNERASLTRKPSNLKLCILDSKHELQSTLTMDEIRDDPSRLMRK